MRKQREEIVKYINQRKQLSRDHKLEDNNNNS